VYQSGKLLKVFYVERNWQREVGAYKVFEKFGRAKFRKNC
jgi:hypothetical protein